MGCSEFQLESHFSHPRFTSGQAPHPPIYSGAGSSSCEAVYFFIRALKFFFCGDFRIQDQQKNDDDGGYEDDEKEDSSHANGFGES